MSDLATPEALRKLATGWPTEWSLVAHSLSAAADRIEALEAKVLELGELATFGRSAEFLELHRKLAEAETQRDDYKREWESACERLTADPHNAKALGERVAELNAEIDQCREVAECTEYDALFERCSQLKMERDAALARLKEAEAVIRDADSCLEEAHACMLDYSDTGRRNTEIKLKQARTYLAAHRYGGSDDSPPYNAPEVAELAARGYERKNRH